MPGRTFGPVYVLIVCVLYLIHTASEYLSNLENKISYQWKNKL